MEVMLGKAAPRFNIPDEWTKSRCPVCQSTPLQVLHLSHSPEQLACGQCGLTFEVEMGGARNSVRIRPKKVPPRLGSKSDLAANTWLTPAELRALTQQVAPSLPVSPSPPAAPFVQVPVVPAVPASVSSSAEDVVERAKKLYALSNPPSQIKAILEGSRATPEAVEAAMTEVIRLDQNRRRSSRASVWLMMGGVALCVAILVGAGIMLNSLRPASPSSSSTVTAGFAIQPTSLPSGGGLSLPGLPDLPGLLPDGAVETVVAQPTTGVQRGVGPGISKCPVTPRGAAELFGGEADDWSQSPEMGGSWMMFASGPAMTIQVPSNMSAGYFSTESGLQMLNVLGPATLSNISFVTISCEQ